MRLILALTVLVTTSTTFGQQPAPAPPPVLKKSATLMVVFTDAAGLAPAGEGVKEKWQEAISDNLEQQLVNYYPFFEVAGDTAKETRQACVLHVTLKRERKTAVGRIYLELRLDDKFGYKAGEVVPGRPAVFDEIWSSYSLVELGEGDVDFIPNEAKYKDDPRYVWPPELHGMTRLGERGVRDAILSTLDLDLSEKQNVFTQSVVARVPFVFSTAGIKYEEDFGDLIPKLILGAAEGSFGRVIRNSEVAIGWRNRKNENTYWYAGTVLSKNEIAGGVRDEWFKSLVMETLKLKTDRFFEFEKMFGTHFGEGVVASAQNAPDRPIAIGAIEASAPTAQQVDSIYAVVTRWGIDYKLAQTPTQAIQQ